MDTTLTTRAHDDRRRDLAWRCDGCGRLHVLKERGPSPERCIDCGNATLSRAGPGTLADRRVPAEPR